MKISTLANRIFEIRKINYLELSQEQIQVTEDNFKNLCKEYLIYLEISNEYEDMYKIVINDWNSLDFPIPLMFKTYQRLIEIKPRGKEIFSMFIDYLLLFGPDWEEEALVIRQLINKHDFLNALELVKKVDYYKTFY